MSACVHMASLSFVAQRIKRQKLSSACMQRLAAY
jgi:hypothetical protein